MNDLSPEARTIVAAGRNPRVFTGAARDRIKRGVLLRLATVGAASASAGTAAGMSLAFKIAIVAVLAAAVGGGAVGFWALRGSAAVPNAAAGDPLPSTNPARALQAPSVAPQDRGTTRPALSQDPGRPDSAKKTNKRPVLAGGPAGSSPTTSASAPLDSELEVLRQAREELRTGFPGNAYERLIEYDRHHGRGALAQERQALSAIALCQWRPGSEAQVRAQEFLRNAPQSPLANRVRLVCEKSNLVAK